MDQIEILNNLGLVDKDDPAYISPKKTGLEQTLEVLKKSYPDNPSIPYLEKLLRKQTERNKNNEKPVS